MEVRKKRHPLILVETVLIPWTGLLVYYQNRGNGDVTNGGSGLKAFPPGFKMISGTPVRRSRKWDSITRYFFGCLLTGWIYRFIPGEGSQGELAERAVEWECLRYTTTTGYNSINSSEWTIATPLPKLTGVWLTRDWFSDHRLRGSLSVNCIPIESSFTVLYRQD